MRNPDCPKCGHIMDTFADDYWCPHCRIKYTKDLVAVENAEKGLGYMEKAEYRQDDKIKRLETKFKVLGVLTLISGIAEVFLAIINPLFILTAFINVILGLYLIS